MSAAGNKWGNLLLKAVGAAFIIIGGAIISNTLMSADSLGRSAELFVFLGAIVMVVGIFPLLAKST